MNMGPADSTPATVATSEGADFNIAVDTVVLLASQWKWLLTIPIAVGLIALGLTFMVRPTYSARTTFLPPQQAQSAASVAIASLGGLAGLVGGGAIKSPAEQYVTLLLSARVADRLIDEFGLIRVYEAKSRTEARLELEQRSRIEMSRKDTLVSVEVDDHDPVRAAAIANRYVDELRKLSTELVLTEAQLRRTFFERQWIASRERLAVAQAALQSSGFNAGSLRSEPRFTAETYARLKAELTAAEVRLAGLRGAMTNDAIEVQQQSRSISALRAQLGTMEKSIDSNDGAGYVARYREFKYEEALFELLSKQYEAARLDEAREGTLIQVIDPATPPERKSRPKRALTAAVSALASLLLVVIAVLLGNTWRLTRRSPALAAALARRRGAA